MYKNDYLEKCLKNNSGNRYLLQGYIYTKNNQYDELIINDLHFIYKEEFEVQNFKNELIKAGIKEFVLTESSSALMDNLHALNKNGIKIGDVKEVRNFDIWNEVECFIKGLKMEVIMSN